MISGISQGKDPKDYFPPLLNYGNESINGSGSRNEEMKDDDSCDTRTFSKTTLSQLRTSFALEKTINNSIKQKLLKKNQLSHRGQSSHSLISTGSGSLDLSSNPGGSKSSELITKFWKSFEKYAITQPGKLGQQDTLLALALPVSSLHPAIQLMSRLNIESEVTQIISTLGLSKNESLSWVEYRNICFQLFQNPTSDTASHTAAPAHSSLSPSHQSQTNGDFSVSSQAYDRLIRIDRTANTIPHSVSEPSLAESFLPDKTPSLQKDSLCVVLKQEYRKIRKTQDTGAPISLMERIPRYQRDTQKKKILSIIDPKEGRPKKWRQIRQQKLNEEAKIQRLKHRNALIQHLKTVVVAQDRTGLNKALLATDVALEEAVDRNMEKRFAEKLQTAHHIETRRYHESMIRAESADRLKHTLRESSQKSQELIQEEKSQRFNALNPLNDSLFTDSRTLSTCTSSKFEVPKDIKNRISYSKRLSEYKKARQDAKLAYEQEMSNRISSYTNMRKEAQLRAESTGCLISLRPLKGSDYFQSDSSTCDPYNDEYFDSSEFMEHLQIGERSGILTAPVLLDPNHQIYRNMTDSMDTTRYTNSAG